MKKDGTSYLAKNSQGWSIVKWGEACGLSSGGAGWVDAGSEFKFRDQVFTEFYTLDSTIQTMQKYGCNKS